MLKGIVFDLDGTLVDSLATTFDAFNHAITQHGGRQHTPEELMSYFGPGEGEIFAQILGAHQADSAYKLCQAYLDENLNRVPLHEGVDELLENAQSAGVPIAIFTGRSWNTTELILNHHGILDRFVTVIAHDHVGHPKPSPEGLHLAASRMNLSPSEILFVGDSPVDMMASRSAGSQGVAALWDFQAKRDLLSPYEPNHWAHHPLDVWKVWKHASHR
jgi:HAD superfamily hydrolase (TIGR01509 family)